MMSTKTAVTNAQPYYNILLQSVVKSNEIAYISLFLLGSYRN